MTGPAVGIQTVFGLAEESTYGTAVTPNRFLEILSETLQRNNKQLVSNGLRGGTRNLRRGSRRVISSQDATGEVKLEVATTGMGVLFKHLLGGTSAITQIGTSFGWSQLHQMGDLTGKSLTLQKQLRDASQNVLAAFTYHGAKILAGDFQIGVDKILELTLTIDAQKEERATGAASASYPTTKLFRFSQGAITIGGSPVANVLTGGVKITNVSNVDRRYLGNAGLKAEPTDNDFPTVTGQLTAEFLDPATLYDLFAADTAAAFVLYFQGDTIAGGGGPESVAITVPEVHFLGETPKVGGAQEVIQTIPYEGAYDGTHYGVKIEYNSTDTAI